MPVYKVRLKVEYEIRASDELEASEIFWDKLVQDIAEGNLGLDVIEEV
jgi:hypothetical protein